MPDTFRDRLVHAWNVFLGRDQNYFYNYGPASSIRQDKITLSLTSERSITGALYNHIAVDVASVLIQHVRLDENKRYIETIDSGLNNCLTIEANIDQSGQDFIRDAVISMFDEGIVALAPIDTTGDPNISASYDINTMRTGRILEWYPEHVKLEVYNDRLGKKQEVVFRKRNVAIIENPLYSIMNEPNSILKRLVTKLNLLDAIDQQSGSGKLDIIIQLPYVIKTEARKAQAESRRKAIEEQLAGSKYGIAYADATEKITQLNRPAENNLMTQIEFLTRMLYSQLGITEAVFNGTADENAMNNYNIRTVDPVLSALTNGMNRSFLTKTARSQGQSIISIKNPFTLVTSKTIGNLIDTTSRNAIISANEWRSVFGFKPDKDPESDKLRNKNLNPPNPAPELKPESNNLEEDINSEGDSVDGQE